MSKPLVARTIGIVGVRRGLTHPQFQTLCRMLVTQKGRGALTGIEVWSSFERWLVGSRFLPHYPVDEDGAQVGGA